MLLEVPGGVHLVETRTPCVESQQRLTGQHVLAKRLRVTVEDSLSKAHTASGA